MREKEFEINLYEPCVANKISEGRKMTICWHVEDLKVSHVDLNEVTKFMDWIEGIYGDLSITRGKVHNYLGMTLNFSTPGELWGTMVVNQKWVPEDLPEVITGQRMRPAVSHLLQVRPKKIVSY